jgi:hypothetical protein
MQMHVWMPVEHVHYSNETGNVQAAQRHRRLPGVEQRAGPARLLDANACVDASAARALLRRDRERTSRAAASPFARSRTRAGSAQRTHVRGSTVRESRDLMISARARLI